MKGIAQPIAVGHEPPPLPAPPSPSSRPDARHRGHDNRPREVSAADRKTSNRFAVLNGFVDFTMHELSRAEALTWLALYRDTKPSGLAKTSQADLAPSRGECRHDQTGDPAASAPGTAERGFSGRRPQRAVSIPRSPAGKRDGPGAPAPPV